MVKTIHFMLIVTILCSGYSLAANNHWLVGHVEWHRQIHGDIGKRRLEPNSGCDVEIKYTFLQRLLQRQHRLDGHAE